MIPLEYWAAVVGGLGGATLLFAACHGRFAEAAGWFLTAALGAGAAVLLLAGCSQAPRPARADAVKVCVSESKMEVLAGSRKIREFPVRLARNGIGNRIGSGKTPLGKFTLTKEPDHRFGNVLRLSGFQGWGRGILIHEGRGRSRGCIHLSGPDLAELFSMLEDGARLHIF